MIKPLPYTLPELRFPKRLESVKRAGVEIAQSIGQFSSNVGRGRPIRARFKDFHVIYFTPFNQPTAWRGINWDDRNVRLFLHGLKISDDRGTCLDVLWDNNEQHVRLFRNPSAHDWDRRLRQLWEEIKRRRVQ